MSEQTKMAFFATRQTPNLLECRVECSKTGMYSIRAYCRRNGGNVYLGRTKVQTSDWQVFPDGYSDPIATGLTMIEARTQAREHLTEQWHRRYAQATAAQRDTSPE